jgi:hypothetical protein
MKLLAGIMIVALAACAAPLAANGRLTSIDPNTPLGADVLGSYERLYDLNASIGGERRAFLVPEPESARHIREAIELRLAADIAMNCGAEPDAHKSVLLIAHVSGRNPDVAYVVRRNEGSGDRSYIRRCGLVYSLEEGSGAILSVTNDEY